MSKPMKCPGCGKTRQAANGADPNKPCAKCRKLGNRKRAVCLVVFHRIERELSAA